MEITERDIIWTVLLALDIIIIIIITTGTWPRCLAPEIYDRRKTK